MSKDRSKPPNSAQSAGEAPSSAEGPEYPICSQCGSHDVARDAWASWDGDKGDWQLLAVFDQAFCFTCDGETRLEWQSGSSTQTTRIRDLNDALRRNGGSNGTIVCTAGVMAEGEAFVVATMKAVVAFEDFSEDNDPHGEHDFGAVIVDGEKLFFKIDYYNLAISAHSPDPADPKLTKRVLTIMRADEY